MNRNESFKSISSLTNLHESFLDNTTPEPRVISSNMNVFEEQPVVYMSPIVHARLSKIETRLNELEGQIEGHMNIVEKCKDEPFFLDNLRSPKSRTEWLFSWNETLKEMMKKKEVYSLSIAVNELVPRPSIHSNENKDKMDIVDTNDTPSRILSPMYCIQKTFERIRSLIRIYDCLEDVIPANFYKNQEFYLEQMAQRNAPSGVKTIPLKRTNLYNYFPLQYVDDDKSVDGESTFSSTLVVGCVGNVLCGVAK